ncbi:MAG TPA: cbb3-type cytochrome c oxidase subunit I [Thermaerobacter sp.]
MRAGIVPAEVRDEYRYVRWHLYTAIFFGLVLGVLMGPLQALDKARINLYDSVPLLQSYYQGLTLHGVALAFIWTSFFIVGFLTFTAVRGFGRPLASPFLSRATLAVMWLGLALTLWAILTDRATVLFTAYAPLRAHWTFYLGVALFVVIGPWLLAANVFKTYRAWKRDHPGEKTPLLAFATLTTLAMWTLATVGVAIEFVVFLIPWALGLREGVNPLLTRSLFWFTGHPIVYWWLLPAYISWYFILPRQAGGKLFSESMARLAFLLFIPFSIPVGFHHMYVDPGVAQTIKAVHAFLTFVVFVPSLITAFTVVASLEIGGRQRGGRGWLGWILKLPWKEPAVAAQLLAMVLFTLGGASGLINASYAMNLLVHNTLFIVGHFHLTVGTAVSLTFMGITYWLIPQLTGKALRGKGVALAQAWLWFLGMALMGRGLAWMGLEGVPRRTWWAQASYQIAGSEAGGVLTAIGGVLLFVSMLLYVGVIVATVRGAEATEREDVPVAEPLDGGMPVPAWLNRLTPWVVGTVVLTVLAWAPMLWQMWQSPFSSPGFEVW